VPIVVRNVPFPSNLIQADRSTVETAGQSEEDQAEDTRLSPSKRIFYKEPFLFFPTVSEIKLTSQIGL
jgi:hypothetical protein